MQKFTFIFILLLGALFLQGQTHRSLSYKFNNSLTESHGIGPALTVLDSMGMFVTDTLNEVSGQTKTVYRFVKNSGLQFNNASAAGFLDSTYSIELYFVFDQLDGWKRVIDWKNRKTDWGAYVYWGKINFYNIVTSDSAPVVPGEYTYYVVTRNGISKNLRMYTDAKTSINFTDVNDDGVIDTSHVLHFFQDDLPVPNEASAGAVALLNLYNYELDSATIKHKFDSLHGQLFAIRETGNSIGYLKVYPNPANEMINIDLSQSKVIGEVNMCIINSTGTVVYQRTCMTGKKYRIDLNALDLANGIYVVKAESGTGIYSQKFVIRR
jgi:OmpA-OmpF porin, OOP family